MADQSNTAPALENPLRIVVVGGGTGLSTLLHGLKDYVPHRGSGTRFRTPAIDITAIVTVTDDGGSSGRLRRDFNVPAPGDIRNCMTALARDEDLLTKLFQYRFESGQGLKGHSFGNLLLTALSNVTGDFVAAVTFASEVLAIAGRIFPSTDRPVALEAHLASGRVVRGETRITKCRSRIRRISLDPKDCRPLPETLDAFSCADLICLGPGSLYTSVIPNLVVPGISAAIAGSPAAKVYIANLMWQTHETMRLSASGHVRPILEHAGRPVVDYVVVNTKPFSEQHLARYAAGGAMPVEVDWEALADLGVRVIPADLLAEHVKVRHEPSVLAELVVDLAREGRRRRTEEAVGAAGLTF